MKVGAAGVATKIHLTSKVTGLMSLALVPLGKDWTLLPIGLAIAVRVTQ